MMNVLCHKGGIVMAACAVLSSLLLSCSKVQFAEPRVEAPSELSFDIDWSDVILDGPRRPDDMTVLMSKVKSVTRHYVWQVDSVGKVIVANESVAEVDKGEYMVAGLSSYIHEDYVVSDVDKFLSSDEVLMKDVYVEIPLLENDEIEALDVLDFNPVSPYIRYVRPLYYVKPENNSLRNIPSENGVPLALKQFTCCLTFPVIMNVEDGVEIESVRGVISGLPLRVYMLSGDVDGSRTGKAVFTMQQTQKDPQTGDMIYEGRVNAFGLLPPEDPKMSTGNCILNVIISAKVEDGDRTFERVFNVTMNMKEKITAAALMSIRDGKKECMRLECKEYRFDIKNQLKVTRKHVMSDAEGGFDIWEPEDGSVEGLNPEI